MTNYRVDQVVRGNAYPVGSWIQLTNEGALPSELLTCQNYAYQIVTDPTPARDGEYVLFLQSGSDGRLTDYFGAYDRFPVISGEVHSDRDVQPDADTMTLAPQELDAFISALKS